MQKGLPLQTNEFINNPDVPVSTAVGCAAMLRRDPCPHTRGQARATWGQTPGGYLELAWDGEVLCGWPNGSPFRALSPWGPGLQMNVLGVGGMDIGVSCYLPMALTARGHGLGSCLHSSFIH